MQADILTERWHRESSWLSHFFVGVVTLFVAWVIAIAPLKIATLSVVASIFVLLVFHEPRWALYALPFAIPFGSIRELSIGIATVGGTEVMLALFLAAWAARGIARRDLRLERPPLMGAFLLWYGTMLFSTYQSVSLSDSAKELVKWAGMFILYAVAAQTLRRRDIVTIVVTTLLAGTLAAAEGIYQSFLQIGPDGFLFPLGGRLWLRAYGRFLQPNPYAGYLGLVLPLAYGTLLAGAGLGGPRSGEEAQGSGEPAARAGAASQFLVRVGLITAAALCAGLMLLALFLTLSRGAWLGAFLALSAAGLLLSRKSAIASLLTGMSAVLAWILGAAGIVPASLVGRAAAVLPYIREWNLDVRGVPITDTNFAVLERLAHWQAAIEMWVARPWLGHGIGNYDIVYPMYRVPPWYDALGHAHNTFLNTMAETGLIGLTAYLLFWGGAYWLALQAVRHSEGLWRGVAIGTLAAMVHLHVHNLVDNLYVHGIYLHVALLLAIAARLGRRAGPAGTAIHDYRESSGKI